MIKKIVFLLLSMILFTGTAFSSGEVRPYVSFKGAASFVQSDFDLGYYYWERRPYYNNGYYYDNYYYRSHYDESTDAVFAGSAALGIKVKSMRFEAEYTYRTPAEQQYREFPDVRQEFNTLMLNFFYDFKISPKVYPYAGFGLGGTHVKNDVRYSEITKKTCFSFAGDIGVSFEVAHRLNLDTGLKIAYLGSMPLEYTDYYMYAVDLYLGLRFTI